MNPETLKAAGRSHVGRVRDHNEDTAAIVEITSAPSPYQLWLVADGMGGGARGEVASATARDELIAGLQAEEDWADPAANLRSAIKRANAAVHTQGTANGELSRSAMGTTLVAALLEPEQGRYWIVNVGDSRAYLAAQGKLEQLTHDHSLVAEQVAAGQMTEAEAKLSGHRNVITRAIGTDEVVEPDIIGPRTLERGERLVLCSDGLHGMVTDAEIATLVSTRPEDEAAEALIQAANAAGGKDNVTAVVGGWEGAIPAAAAPPEGGAWPGRRRLPFLGGAAVLGLAIAGAIAFLAWPSGADDRTYTVKEKQTCAIVATANKISEAELRAANPNLIGGSQDCVEGMKLTIPAPGTPTATAAQGQAPQGQMPGAGASPEPPAPTLPATVSAALTEVPPEAAPAPGGSAGGGSAAPGSPPSATPEAAGPTTPAFPTGLPAIPSGTLPSGGQGGGRSRDD